MTAKELIEKLKLLPENTIMWNNVEEDIGEAGGVKLITKEDEEFYAKGNKPSELGQTFPYGVIY